MNNIGYLTLLPDVTVKLVSNFRVFRGAADSSQQTAPFGEIPLHRIFGFIIKLATRHELDQSDTFVCMCFDRQAFYAPYES